MFSCKVSAKMLRQVSLCHAPTDEVSPDSASLTFQPKNLLTCPAPLSFLPTRHSFTLSLEGPLATAPKPFV